MGPPEEEKNMKKMAAILLVLILISGIFQLEVSNEKAEGKLLDDGILINRSPILIDSDLDFTSANGVISGSGTPSDPFIIENWKINASSDDGISIANTDLYFIIRNCWVVEGDDDRTANWHNGILYTNMSNGSIFNCQFDNNSYGIKGIKSQNITIFQNTFKDNMEGIKFQDQCQGISIINNSFSHNSIGIGLSSGSDNCLVANNVIDRSYEAGIYLRSCSGNLTIENNICTNAYSEKTLQYDRPSADGIRIYHTSGAIVRYNNCSGNSKSGIFLLDSHDNLILENKLFDNKWAGDGFNRYGINIIDSKRNTFLDNQLKNCGIFLIMESSNISESNSIDDTNTVNGKSVLFLKNSKTDENLEGEYGYDNSPKLWK